MKMRTINEAAEALGISRHRIRCGVEAGRYPAMRWGHRRLVDLDVLEPIVRAEDIEREKAVGIGAISEMTGLPRTTIRRMCRDGVLPYTQDKRSRYMFRPSDVMAEIEKMME